MFGKDFKKQLIESITEEMRVKFVEMQEKISAEYNNRLMAKLDGWDAEVKKYLHDSVNDEVIARINIMEEDIKLIKKRLKQ